MDRSEIIVKHKTFIFNEFSKCCQQLNIDEQIHFTDTILKLLPAIFQDAEDITIWVDVEQELYKKYRNKMQYFAVSGFLYHFFKKSEYALNFFKEQISGAEPYSQEEYNEFFIEVYSMLENIKTFLYISDPSSKGLSKVDSENEKLILTSVSGGKHQTFDTRPQQVLLMYYIAKGLGIREKIEIPVTKIAIFYHHLFGWEYKDINNSQIYKLLKKAPEIKTDKKLLYKDLLWVKDQITLLGLEDVIKLIDKELKKLEAEIH